MGQENKMCVRGRGGECEGELSRGGGWEGGVVGVFWRQEVGEVSANGWLSVCWLKGKGEKKVRGERDRERGRARETERDIDRERDTERETERERERETDRERGRKRDRQRERGRNRDRE